MRRPAACMCAAASSPSIRQPSPRDGAVTAHFQRSLLGWPRARRIRAELRSGAAVWLAVGASSRFCVPLIVLVAWAVLSGALAFFADDPVGTETHGAGAVHGVLAAVAFFAILVGALVVSLGVPRLSSWRPVSGPLITMSLVALIALLLLGHAHFGPHTLGGLGSSSIDA